MFVLTVKSKLNSKKAKILLGIASVVLILVLFIAIAPLVRIPPWSVYCEGHGEYSTVVENDEQAKSFCEQFSYEVEELYSIQQIYVPVEFNDKYKKYNELQKTQGLDLEPYKGKLCIQYIYKLENYKLEKRDAYISIIVYKDRVIGGHISTRIENGEMYNIYGELE